MAKILNTRADIHARIMEFAVCDPSEVIIEEDYDNWKVVVTVPEQKLLIEPDELKSVLKAGLSPIVPITVEAI